MIAVIKKPIDLDRVRPLGQQRIVKIGVIDPIRAQNEPFPKHDANVVIRKLKHDILTIS
jgi:hypothetical protein